MYAVLEWNNAGDPYEASVIATDQSKYTAELVVKITPPHLHREIITMEELKEMQHLKSIS